MSQYNNPDVVKRAAVCSIKEGMTIRDAAKKWAVSESTIGRWVHKAKLDAEFSGTLKEVIPPHPKRMIFIGDEQFKELIGEAIKEQVLSSEPLAHSLDTLTEIVGKAVKEQLDKQGFLDKDHVIQLFGHVVGAEFGKRDVELNCTKGESRAIRDECERLDKELKETLKNLEIAEKKLEIEHLLYADLQKKMQTYLEKAQESLSILRF